MAQTQCLGNPVMNNVTIEYGSQEGFYHIGSGIAEGLAGQLSDDVLKRISDLTYTSSSDEDISGLISSIAKSQAPAIVFFVVGILFCVATLLAAWILVCVRCCCKRRKAHYEETTPKVQVIIGAVLLIVAIAFLLTGVIIYGIAVSDLFKTIAIIPTQVAVIGNNLVKITTTATDQLNCISGQTFDQTLDELDHLPDAVYASSDSSIAKLAKVDMGAVQASVSNIQQQATNLNGQLTPFAGQAGVPQLQDQLTQIANAANNLNGEITTISAETASTQKNVRDQLNDTISGSVSDIKQSVADTKKSTTDALNSASSALKDVDNTINQAQSSIDDLQKKITTWGGYSAIQAGLKAIIAVPVSLALAFLVFGLLASFGRLANYKTPARDRSGLSNGSGCAVVAFAIIMLFTVWIVMLSSSLLFAAGYGIAAICKPLFHDDQMRLYKVADDHFTFNITNMNGQTTNVKLSDILINCKNGNTTVFTALGGPNLIDLTTILASIDQDHLTKDVTDAINGANFQIDLQETQVRQLQADATALSTAASTFDPAALPAGLPAELGRDLTALANSVTDTIQQLTDVVNNLESVAGKTPAQLKQELIDESGPIVNSLHSQFTDQANALTDELEKKTMSCSVLYDQYEAVGDIACHSIGGPVQGMWAAAGLAALFYISGVVGLLLISSALIRRYSDGINIPDIPKDDLLVDDLNDGYQSDHLPLTAHDGFVEPPPAIPRLNNARVATAFENAGYTGTERPVVEPWETKPSSDSGFVDPLVYPDLSTLSGPSYLYSSDLKGGDTTRSKHSTGSSSRGLTRY